MFKCAEDCHALLSRDPLVHSRAELTVWCDVTPVWLRGLSDHTLPNSPVHTMLYVRSYSLTESLSELRVFDHMHSAVINNIFFF